MKLCKHRGFAHYPSRSALLLEKLYLLSEASNRGIGGQALLFAEAYARDLDKELVWLDTMQQGPALGFYLKNGYMLLGTRQLDLPGVLESERHMFVLGKKLSLT